MRHQFAPLLETQSTCIQKNNWHSHSIQQPLMNAHLPVYRMLLATTSAYGATAGALSIGISSRSSWYSP